MINAYTTNGVMTMGLQSFNAFVSKTCLDNVTPEKFAQNNMSLAASQLRQELIDTINSASEIPWPPDTADLMRPDRQPPKSLITFLRELLQSDHHATGAAVIFTECACSFTGNVSQGKARASWKLVAHYDWAKGFDTCQHAFQTVFLKWNRAASDTFNSSSFLIEPSSYKSTSFVIADNPTYSFLTKESKFSSFSRVSSDTLSRSSAFKGRQSPKSVTSRGPFTPKIPPKLVKCSLLLYYNFSITITME